MQTLKASLNPNFSAFIINNFGEDVLGIINSIPGKLKKAVQSGKGEVSIMSFSVSDKFSFSRDDFDSLPGIRVYDYCRMKFQNRANLVYVNSKSGRGGRYDIVVSV